MARLGVAETGMGRVEHKTAKHLLVADKTPGTEDIVSEARTGDHGLTLVEMAPFGLVAASPPAPTPAKRCCATASVGGRGQRRGLQPSPPRLCHLELRRRPGQPGLQGGGRPRNSGLLGGPSPPWRPAKVMQTPSRHQAAGLHRRPRRGEGGALLRQEGLRRGRGQSPVIVDDTADIRKAAKDIIDGCTFDNNLPCIAEKEVFAFQNIADELIHYMRQNGAYLMSAEQADALAQIVLVDQEDKKTGKMRRVINRKCVGRDADVLLSMIGVKADKEIRCLICETDFGHPFVQEELMMPILPIVRVGDIDEAIDLAVKAEHGNRHTAHMHSKNVDHLSRFAKAVETTIFVKNAPSYAGHRLRRGRTYHLHHRGPHGRGHHLRPQLHPQAPLRDGG